MAPKKNKGGTNGFYFFMLELRQQYGNRYRMDEMPNIAGPMWSRMGPDQRQPYNDRARAQRAQALGGGGYTSLNESIDEVKRHEEEQKNKVLMMQKQTRQLVKTLYDNDMLQTHNFYLLHFNDFVLRSQSGNNTHYPAEVALLRFNLQEGVLEHNIYHAMTKPGALPIGYAYNAKRIAEESHRIEVPKNGEYDLDDHLTKIIDFLMMDSIDGVLPTIYIRHDDDYSDEILQQVADNCGFDASKLVVHSLSYLLFCLKNQICGDVWSTTTISDDALGRDTYDYTPDISCEYHELCDCSKYCSKSIVTRSAYVICENGSSGLHIRLIPGQHIPKGHKEKFKHNAPLSAASFYSDHTSIRDDVSTTSSYRSLRNGVRELNFVETESTTMAGSECDFNGGGEWNEVKYSHKRSSDEMRTDGGEAKLRRPVKDTATSSGCENNMPKGRGRGRRQL